MRAIRLLTVVYLVFTAFGVLLWRAQHRPTVEVMPPYIVQHDVPVDATTPQSWFNEMRPYCNAEQVVSRMQTSPPPAGNGSGGYAAACWAMAGQIDEARTLIESMGEAHRSWSASVIFGAVHGKADAGAELEVAPAMELVLEYQPDNVMALYHAGSAAYATGRTEAAENYLESFIKTYGPEDGWKSNARAMLTGLPQA